MNKEKPSMSMCVNLTDYHQKTIKWQAQRIEELESMNQEMHRQVSGYLSGDDWNHWQEHHAERFKL